jgi:chromosome segregation ATPase
MVKEKSKEETSKLILREGGINTLFKRLNSLQQEFEASEVKNSKYEEKIKSQSDKIKQLESTLIELKSLMTDLLEN